MKQFPLRRAALIGLIGASALLASCTQEQQNQMKRSVQNWTGTDGILEIYSGGTVVRRFLKIDKLSTATGTSDGGFRQYRFGYGIYDANNNGLVDPGEKRVYFEISDFTQYIFYGNPN
ncbi:hypothetical protein [Amphibiibacter pelophylacis]|uniref:Uncharacterized protein n=1 Tax=Amphibiibacter pelophylacis TaxID=1799477 RepID=A0ACC6NZ86_9BURK